MHVCLVQCVCIYVYIHIQTYIYIYKSKTEKTPGKYLKIKCKLSACNRALCHELEEVILGSPGLGAAAQPLASGGCAGPQPRVGAHQSQPARMRALAPSWRTEVACRPQHFAPPRNRWRVDKQKFVETVSSVRLAHC